MSVGRRLFGANLAALPASVRRPAFDRATLTLGHAHIGVGAFHRCHQAEYVDDMLEARLGPWGLLGINFRPPHVGAASNDAFAACKGVDFQTSGTYDVDLKTVHVGGRITIDGAAPVATDEGGGRITFTSSTFKGQASVPITTDAQYATTLAPGTYDIGYAPNVSACGAASASGAPSAWPCNVHILKKAVALSANGVLDIDLPTVVVRGAVTLKGQPFAEQPLVTFAESGAVASAPASATALAGQGYQIRLFKGSYDVGYAPVAQACGTAAPCNRGVLKSNVNLGSSGVLDVDVPMVVARGAVSFDGAPMSGATGAGSVSFSAAGATPTTTPSVAPGAAITIANDGTYAIGLLPDTYVVAYSGVPSVAPGSLLPRGGGVIKPGIAIMSDGTLDLDVPTASVSGKVTIGGAAIPATSAARGSVSFSAPVTGGVATVGASLTPILADGTYSTVVVAGTYDVGFATPSVTCAEGGVLPCNGGTLQTLALTKGGVLDLDLKVVTVRGKVTLNGAALPSATTPPSVTFTSPASAAAAPETVPAVGLRVAVSADATYAARLLAGTYDVGYGGASCTAENPDMGTDMPLPCNGGTVVPAVSLTSDGALDVDVTSAMVSGRVTLAGKPVPTSTEDRGKLLFSGKASGVASTDSFGTDGPVTYKAHLLRGRYIVMYSPEGACTDETGKTSSALPCLGIVLAGCD